MSTNAGSHAAHGSHKQPRVLACVLCQHRKIKCDRNTPCSNCIKANVTCTPSTPAPARKRRRPNQDLQERLARCEELLKQYANAPTPTSVQRPQATSAPLPVTPAPPALATPITNGPPSEAPTSTPMSCDSQQSRKPGTMLVAEDGTVRFMDSYVFASVYDELQKMRDIVETDDPEDSSILGSEEMTPDNNADLFLYGDVCRTNLEELQPDPIHIFRLWQVFLDRINPLTKLIHAPTMQPTIIEAATNMTSMPLNCQALLFSVFAMAVVAMTPTECIQTLGIPRVIALQRFNTGTKTALIKYNFMKNYNMTALQALVLYLFSLEGRYDRHASWVLSGTIVRIAQKMGYHRDGEQLNLTPFETEMRRRIWWHIVMQDSKCAMMSGLSQAWTLSNWDTKLPSNLNDADLFPGSDEPVQGRDGPTEMAFCVILHELFRFKVTYDRDDDSNVFEAAVVGQTLDEEPGSQFDTKGIFEKFRIRAQEIETRLIELENQLVDVTAGNVHIAALALRPMLIHRMKEMLDPLHEQPEWGTEIFGPKDKFFKVLLMALEHKTACHERMAAAGFQWFMRYHLQLDVLAVFTGLLQDRPKGSLSDRAWEAMSKVYAHHADISDMSVKQHVAQAQITLRAWKTRETALAQMGQQVTTPQFIHRLRELVPSQDPRLSNPSTLTSPASTTQPQPGVGFDQLFGDYLNSSSMNWEVFGDFMANNGPQLSAAMFDGYSLNNMNFGNGV
ncbi:Pyriculol/pyriculariol biosynthesis cluster transcription factor 1 [Cladobotryum mycophilum]|uniref:Pyriculol/pyriculariol biosynthesis cluster transcription factor 1 n=1 Tax=Cladobotryum mycophilum TaxID=491253 RepID=A0ABR0SPE8_9HYPO